MSEENEYVVTSSQIIEIERTVRIKAANMEQARRKASFARTTAWPTTPEELRTSVVQHYPIHWAVTRA